MVLYKDMINKNIVSAMTICSIYLCDLKSTQYLTDSNISAQQVYVHDKYNFNVSRHLK